MVFNYTDVYNKSVKILKFVFFAKLSLKYKQKKKKKFVNFMGNLLQ